jgi:hypothetical protein
MNMIMNKLIIVYSAVYPIKENTNKSSTIKTTNLQNNNNNNKTAWKLQQQQAKNNSFLNQISNFHITLSPLGVLSTSNYRLD